MKKIGIITLYYNSINYGGNLQAYALCKLFQKSGVPAEQIQFYHDTLGKVTLPKGLQIFQWKYMLKAIRKVIKLPYTILHKLRLSKYKKEYSNIVASRQAAFKHFAQDIIPHSSNVYSSKNIQDCVNDYDIFITGSDQVWNFDWYSPAYFLDFVPSDKIKLSYAASISMKSFNKDQKEIVRHSLSDYKAISVREPSAIELLSSVTDKQPVLVLDPTLLLEYDDWDEISSERIIEEEYVFCYFLGYNTAPRQLAERFVKEKGLKLVAIPYAAGNLQLANAKFGDIQLKDVSPEQFLSLIKYASYIFTDSFHAVVFSFVFKKQFFVFNRDKNGTMSTRIENITEMFGFEDRFCSDSTKETLAYIESLPEINYNVDFKKYEKYKDKSYKFIENNVLTFVTEK